MSKSRYRPEHMRMLNDKRWLETKRVVWARAEGLCEWCKRDGYIVAGVDCHHLVPFESANTQAEMERLCYDPNNCVLLCVPCHVRVHKELGSKKKENVKARRDQAFERWKEKQQRPPQSYGEKADAYLSDLERRAAEEKSTLGG